MREKLEKRIYENIASLNNKEKVIEMRMMSPKEEKKQIELFRKRLQKENSRKTGKKSYRKLAAAVALVILLPGSVYAATHYENIKEMWFQQFSNQELAQIHDKNWGKKGQKETVYEAFGVKLIICSCFLDQEDGSLYLSYKIEDSSKVDRHIVNFDNTSSLNQFIENDNEAVVIDFIPVDKNGEKKEVAMFREISYGWLDEETGVNFLKVDLQKDVKEKKIIPQIEITKRTIDSAKWSDNLEYWNIVGTKKFDMPKAEHLETKIIPSEEDETLKLRVSQQSIRLYADSKQNEKVDIIKLQRKNYNAKIYTKDGEFELNSKIGYYDDVGVKSVEYEYILGGADLSQIEKIKIGKYTFVL